MRRGACELRAEFFRAVSVAFMMLCFHLLLSQDYHYQTMTATTREIIKRRRISPSLFSSSDHAPPPQNIRDLAVEPLTHVASFLPYPSRAMFAIAISFDLSHFIWDEETQPSMTIWWIDSGRCLDEYGTISLSSQQIAGKCDNLDFGDMRKIWQES